MTGFNGHGGGGEHRTTGVRAWCHECREWCYPEEPCGQQRCCAERFGLPVLDDGRHFAIDGRTYEVTDVAFDMTVVHYVLPEPSVVVVLRAIKEET